MVIPGTVLGIDTKDGTGWGQGQGTGMGRGKNNIWGGKMGRGGGRDGILGPDMETKAEMDTL